MSLIGAEQTTSLLVVMIGPESPGAGRIGTSLLRIAQRLRRPPPCPFPSAAPER